MKLIFKTLYIIGLSFFIVSCGTKRVVSTPKESTVKPIDTAKNPAPEEKPEVKIIHKNNEDFFRTNIADISKNDNTASFGSIVSAKLPKYEVVKTYFPAIAQNFRQRYIILHYTALDHDKSITVLTQQSVSSHYLINDFDDDEIYQLVDENKRAYHAGVSAWRKDSQLNDTSIGIEIVNSGYVKDSLGQKIFPPYQDFQIKKVAALVKNLIERYNVPATNILGHSDIAPTRKQDPGPQFPWKKLYDEYQIGMWYDETAKENFYNQTVNHDFTALMQDATYIYKVQSDLKKFGYDVATSGTLDDATKRTIEAFQFHFRPEKYDGIWDGETWAILQVLIQKYPPK